MTIRTLLSLVVLVPSLGAVPLPGDGGSLRAQVAVVVGTGSPLTQVSLDDLRGMYLGKITKLGSGERVILLESPRSRETFYQNALRMSPDRVKRHWIGVVFSGAGALPPREIASTDELQEYLRNHPGAIGFVDSHAVGSGVKVLTINGRKPGDADYPIR